MNFFNLGDWANLSTVAVPIAGFFGWLATRFNKMIDQHLQETMRANNRNLEISKENSANQSKLSDSIDKLRQSIDDQRYETMYEFGKRDVELAKHDSRIATLEHLEGIDKGE